MDDKNFQINKKDLVSKFRALVKKHAERGDDYNPKHGKISANHRDYFVLDKIRAVYNWVIGEIKIELRRKYIHDDKMYHKVVGELEKSGSSSSLSIAALSAGVILSIKVGVLPAAGL